MSLSWPAAIKAYKSEMLLKYNTTTFVSPLTGARQVLQRQGVIWTQTASFRLNRTLAQAFEGFLATVKGSYETINVWDFARPTPLGPNLTRAGIARTRFSDGTTFSDGTWFAAGTSDVIVYYYYLAETTEIVVDGFRYNTTPLLAGDYLGILGRQYILTQDLSVNAVGRGTAHIAPGLRTVVPKGTPVTSSYVTTPMYLVDDGQPKRDLTVGESHLYTLSFREEL